MESLSQNYASCASRYSSALECCVAFKWSFTSVSLAENSWWRKPEFIPFSVLFGSLFPELRSVTGSGGARGWRWGRAAVQIWLFLCGCGTLFIHLEHGKGQDKLLLLTFFWFSNCKPRYSGCNDFIKGIKAFLKMKIKYLETANSMQFSRMYFSYCFFFFFPFF